MFQTFFRQSAAELILQAVAAGLVLVPVLYVALRSRPQTMNHQIDALARKSRSRDEA